MSVGTPASRSVRPAPSTGGGRGVSYGPQGNYKSPVGRPANSPRAPLPVIPGGGVPKAVPFPKRGGWPYTVLSLAYGAMTSTWFPPAIPKAPMALNPGLLTSMDFDPAAPYADSKYRTNLTPRTSAPGSAPVMMYDLWLQWAITGSPRAYWGPSWLWNPSVGYYPIHQPNGDFELLPQPWKKPPPKRDPWSPPEYFPAYENAPVPPLVPLADPGIVPSPGPKPQPLPIPTYPVAYIPGIDVYPDGKIMFVSPKGPPPLHVKERKSRNRTVAGILGLFFGLFNAMTELMDFVEALLAGFGENGNLTYAEKLNKLLDILENPGDYPEFDLNAFTRALILNEIEDHIVGNMNAALRKRLRALGIRIYGSTTPGSGWI